MKAYVVLSNGRIKIVSENWLLNHAWNVERVTARMGGKNTITLTAYLSDGRKWRGEYDTQAEAWVMLHRRSLWETPLDWFGYDYTIQPGQKHKVPTLDTNYFRCYNN